MREDLFKSSFIQKYTLLCYYVDEILKFRRTLITGRNIINYNEENRTLLHVICRRANQILNRNSKGINKDS